MTESVRHGRYSPASSGAAFDPVSPQQRGGRRHGDAWHTATEFQPDVAETDVIGVDPAELDDDDLMRELHSLHRTRLDTLRHASDTALATHLRRTAELETEYLARHPGREIDPDRLRDGA